MQAVAQTSEADNERLKSHIRHALALPCRFLNKPLPGDEKHQVVIVGGGPSASGFIDEFKWHKSQGREIWALNRSFGWLKDNGIEPDGHIMHGTQPEYAALVPDKTDATLFYASQCHPAVFARGLTASPRMIVWHPRIKSVSEVLGSQKIILISGGTTLGMQALSLAAALGCRSIFLYGFDSSYRGNTRHMGEQDIPTTEPSVRLEMGDRHFETSADLAQQVREFRQLMPALASMGCEISIQGDGLLACAAQKMGDGPQYEGLIQIDGLWWPAFDTECRWAANRFIGDIKHILEFCPRRGTALQAGGNVGVWPIEFARHFAQVVTFEPDALNYECLARNTKGFPNINKHKCGLGDRREKVGLSRDPSNCGAHFVAGEGDIDILTIDETDLQSCDLIQLDVEGYEYKALAGGLKTIGRFKPVIVTEEKHHGERYGIKDEEILKLLQPLGYRIIYRMNRDVIYSVESKG